MRSFLGADPYTTIETDAHLEVDLFAQLLEQVFLTLQQMKSGEGDRKLLEKTTLQLLEECLARIPGLLVKRVDATQLHATKFLSAQDTAINQCALLKVGSILSRRILELKRAQVGRRRRSNVNLIEFCIAADDRADHRVALIWIVLLSIERNNVNQHFLLLFAGLSLTTAVQICTLRVSNEVAGPGGEILSVLVLVAEHLTTNRVGVRLEAHRLTCFSKIELCARFNRVLHF